MPSISAMSVVSLFRRLEWPFVRNNNTGMYSDFKSPIQGLAPKRRGAAFLILLTVGVGGLQGVFAVQFAGGSPYLATLGFDKTLMSLVWAAGPLSGILGQAYFGICSDQSRCPWGKRRPYIAIGTLCIILSLLSLAWTEEVAYFLARGFGCSESRHFVKVLTLITATISVYGLNLAIQPVQGGMRALMVDSCPTDQLDAASAWAARMTGLGNLLGYGSGFYKLYEVLPALGNTQFKVLSVLASFGLAISISVLCAMVQERDPSMDDPPEEKLRGHTGKLIHIFSGIRRMPPEVAKVCKVQFAAWSAWFVFLYYITTYVGQIYIRETLSEQSHSLPISQLHATEDATREGSIALLAFAAVSLVTGICIPPLLQGSYVSGKRISFEASPRSTWLSPKYVWLCSHILFAACMFSTSFVKSVNGTVTLVGVLGVSWAMTCWVPYALISTELSRLNAQSWQLDGITAIEAREYETQPGIVIGLHNIAIAAPQLLSTVASGFVFWLWRHQTGAEDKSVEWVLRIGGVSALLAAYLATKLR